MAKREATIPESWLFALRKEVSGFRLETVGTQCELASMIWRSNAKQRQHHHFVGAASYHFQALNKAFGRNKFREINARLGLFVWTPNWSAKERWTRGYWLSDSVALIRERYLDQSSRKPTRLLMANGKVQRTLPAAVASKDMRGLTTKAWTNARALQAVPVNMGMLERTRKWLCQVRDQWRRGHAPRDLFMVFPSLEVVERWAELFAQVLRMARTDVAGVGYVPHHYVQAESGRLYAQGVSLQTVPTLVKQAALSGLWEYDFSNCHFAILTQMADACGLRCEAIASYLEDKQATRYALAQSVGIRDDEAKTCLLAVMYGARASEWHDSAIPKALGVERARNLYRNDIFLNIQRDIAMARERILLQTSCTPNGRLSNAFGCAISRSAKPAEKMAHLIQGVEALALKTVVDLYPDNIVLVQHDGFAANAQLDVRAIERAVSQATGHKLSVEEKRIEVDPRTQFHRKLSKNPNCN